MEEKRKTNKTVTVLKTPKTESSVRKVFLPRTVAYQLIEWKKEQDKLKLNGGDIKAVQGDSGHSKINMVTDVYSHIIDDDRRRNAELLAKVLANPEMAALLTSLAKTMK